MFQRPVNSFVYFYLFNSLPLIKWLLSLPSFLIKRLRLEEIKLLVQDHPGSGQNVATHICPIRSPRCSALTPEAHYPLLCARDV